MASVVGHALGALAVWEVGRRRNQLPVLPAGYLIPLALAVLPDVDVLIPALPHRGASHSLLVATLFGLLAAGALVVGTRRSVDAFFKILPFTLGCAFSHLVLDYLMGRSGPALPLLWPWGQGGWVSPVQAIPTAYYPKSLLAFLLLPLHLPSLAGMLLEAFSLGGLWMAARSDSLVRRRAWLGVALAGFLLTVGVYWERAA
jgi:membrane-bound metal-dependent hydrolase YbcI (DUF457 family)